MTVPPGTFGISAGYKDGDVGAKVTAVAPSSPLKGLVKPGDIIMKNCGQDIMSREHLENKQEEGRELEVLHSLPCLERCAHRKNFANLRKM